MGRYKSYLKYVQNGGGGGWSRPLLDNVQKKDAFFLLMASLTMLSLNSSSYSYTYNLGLVELALAIQNDVSFTGSDPHCFVNLPLEATTETPHQGFHVKCLFNTPCSSWQCFHIVSVL